MSGPPRQPRYQPGRDRRRDKTAGQQCSHDHGADAGRAQPCEEARRGGQGDHELGGVHAADDGARCGATACQQRRGRHRAPAATAGRVHETADQAQQGEEPDRVRTAPDGGAGRRAHREADQDVQPQCQQEARGHGRGRLGAQMRQDHRAQERARRSREAQARHESPVGVAQPVVGRARDECRADLGQVDARARQGGADPDQQEQRGGGDAVAHAEGAIDELGGQAHKGQDEELSHGLIRSVCAGAVGAGGHSPGTSRCLQAGLTVTTSPRTMTAGALTPTDSATSGRHRRRVVVTR